MACPRRLILRALLAWTLLPALLALVIILPASAQSYPDEGAAYQACMVKANADVAAQPTLRRNPICKKSNVTNNPTPTSFWACFDTRSSASLPWNTAGGCTSRFDFGNTCASRPDWNGPYTYLTGGRPKNGSVTCNAGCRQAWYSSGDGYFTGKYSSVPGTCSDYDDNKCKADFGSGYYWNSAMSACEPDEGKCPGGGTPNSLGQCQPEPCPAGMTQQADGTCKNKENECPAGQVKSPAGACLPGDGQCAAGEARGKDGTCKKDADGDGNPDEEEEGGDDPGEGENTKEEFSGGDDCKVPPSCSGSPILCGQARIQWRIDCNTRKNRNIAGGMCSTPPICTGEKCDALEYTSLLMQWRTACAVEKALTLGNNGGGETGQPDWTKVGSMSQDPGAGSSPSDTNVLTTKKIGVADLDQSGVGGGGGQCIGFASGGGQGVASGFTNALASPPGYFCDYINTVRAIIILCAAVASVFILTRGA